MSTTLATILLVLGMGLIGGSLISLIIATIATPFAMKNEQVATGIAGLLAKPAILAVTFALAYWWIGASVWGALGACLFLALTLARPPRREAWEDDL